MCNTPIHQEITNQDFFKIFILRFLPQPEQLETKIQRATNAVVPVGKGKHSVTAGGCVNLCNLCGSSPKSENKFPS